MKRLILSFVFCFLSSFSIFSQNIEMKVTIPGFARLVGVGPKTQISIYNSTPFYLKLIAMGEMVEFLEPGGCAYERYTSGLDYTKLPIVVIAYSDKECKNLVGIGGKVLSVQLGSSASWEVRVSDLRYPDGRSQTYYYNQIGYPYPAKIAGGSYEVNFPELPFANTTAFQIVNATLFRAEVRINSIVTETLENAGDTHFFIYSNRYKNNTPINIDVVFMDGARYVGHFSMVRYINNAPDAVQCIIDPSQIH